MTISQLNTATDRFKNAASLFLSARVHITMLIGSIPEAPEIQILCITLYYRPTAVVPIVSAFEGLHCTPPSRKLSFYLGNFTSVVPRKEVRSLHGDEASNFPVLSAL